MRLALLALLVVATNAAAGGTVAPRLAEAPTLGEFGLIALAVIVGVAGGVVARRRKK